MNNLTMAERFGLHMKAETALESSDAKLMNIANIDPIAAIRFSEITELLGEIFRFLIGMEGCELIVYHRPKETEKLAKELAFAINGTDSDGNHLTFYDQAAAKVSVYDRIVALHASLESE